MPPTWIAAGAPDEGGSRVIVFGSPGVSGSDENSPLLSSTMMPVSVVSSDMSPISTFSPWAAIRTFWIRPYTSTSGPAPATWR